MKDVKGFRRKVVLQWFLERKRFRWNLDFSASMTVAYFLILARPARIHIAGTLGREMFRRPTMKGSSSVTSGGGRKYETWRILRENPQPGGLHIGSCPIPSHATSTSCGTAGACPHCYNGRVVQPSRMRDRIHTYARCRPYVLHPTLLSQRPFRTESPLHAAPGGVQHG